MLRSTTVLIALTGMTSFMLCPTSASAHENNKGMRATCTLTNSSGRAQMTVLVENQLPDPIHNIAPSDLLAGNVGTASIFIQSFPRTLRELLPGKTAEFIWKGRLYGDGYLDLSLDVTAEMAGGAANSTGIINCNRLAVGNPGTVEPPPTNTRRPTEVSQPPTATPPQNTPTLRPTEAGRPTRTPRATEAPRPTRTPIVVAPTRTPRQDPTEVRPTNTPIQQAPTRTPQSRPTARATRTPVVSAPTPTSRATRTPVVAAATPTRRPTRTPLGAGAPTRTPQGPAPTATRGSGGGIDLSGLRGSCTLRRNIDLVSITLILENRTGRDLTNIAGGRVDLEPEGGTLFFDRTGPSPRAHGNLRTGQSAAFVWTGRLSAGGTMGFVASASATGPTGEFVETGMVDCGVATAEGPHFDPSQFAATCSISPGTPGSFTLNVHNGTGGVLEEIEPLLISRATTGSAQVLNIHGPGPRNATRFDNGQGRGFVWRADILGNGEVTMRFEAKATRPNGQRISTGSVDCGARLATSGGNLPDMTVDEADLRQSVEIETKNFAPDNCAVVEGCIGGTGQRRLLRFNTTTPNLGPGDVFVGNPSGNQTMIYSQCHNHYHFQDYSDYRLLDMQGNLVARGHKQAFCLIDGYQFSEGADRTPQFVDCGFQGISAGWADVYHRGLDCQWIDITGVPEGRYVLEVVVNPAHVIEEHNYSNNAAHAEVYIPRQ